MTKKRATKAEMQARTSAVYKLLLNGASRSEILVTAAQKWESNERSADALIARANVIFEQQAEAERDTMRGLALARLNVIFGRAMKVQDYRVALSAQKQLSDLLALETPKTLRIVAEVLTPEDVKLLAQLLEAVAGQGYDAGTLFNLMLEEIASTQEAAQDE